VAFDVILKLLGYKVLSIWTNSWIRKYENEGKWINDKMCMQNLDSLTNILLIINLSFIPIEKLKNVLNLVIVRWTVWNEIHIYNICAMLIISNYFFQKVNLVNQH